MNLHFVRGVATAASAGCVVLATSSAADRRRALDDYVALRFRDRIEFLSRCATSTSNSDSDDGLFDWLERRGGSRHPSLTVAHFGNKGTEGWLRGYAATEDVAVGDLIVALPLETCCITVEDALRDERIGPRLRSIVKRSETIVGSSSGIIADTLPLVLLALYLCHHKRRGKASPWAPVIRSFPTEHDALFSWTREEWNELEGTDLEGAGERDALSLQRIWNTIIVSSPGVEDDQSESSYSYEEFSTMYGVLLGRYFGAPTEDVRSDKEEEEEDTHDEMLERLRSNASVWPMICPVADLLNHSVGAGSWAYRTTTSGGEKKKHHQICFFSDEPVAKGEQLLIDYSSYASLAVGVRSASAVGEQLPIFFQQSGNAHHLQHAGFVIAANVQETVWVELDIDDDDSDADADADHLELDEEEAALPEGRPPRYLALPPRDSVRRRVFDALTGGSESGTGARVAFVVGFGGIVQGEMLAASRLLSCPSDDDVDHLLERSALSEDDALATLRRRNTCPLGPATEAAAQRRLARTLQRRLARFATGSPLDERRRLESLQPGRVRAAVLYRMQQKELLVDAIRCAHNAAAAAAALMDDGSTDGTNGTDDVAAAGTSSSYTVVRGEIEAYAAEALSGCDASAALRKVDALERRRRLYALTAAVLANSAEGALAHSPTQRLLSQRLPTGARVALAPNSSNGDDSPLFFDLLVHLGAKLNHADALRPLLDSAGFFAPTAKTKKTRAARRDPIAALRVTRERIERRSAATAGAPALSLDVAPCLSLDLDWRDGEGWSPLLVAAGEGATRAVELLCSRGADVEFSGPLELRPLHIAAAAGNSVVIKALLAAGADARAAPTHGSVRGETALHIAASRRNKESVAALLDAGADAAACGADGATPLDRLRLHEASEAEAAAARDIAELLIVAAAKE